MASRITRIIREAAEATTDASRQAVGNRMAGLTDRVRNFADRLRDGKAGRVVGHLMDRLRGDDEAKPRRSRRSASPSHGGSPASSGRGSSKATSADANRSSRAAGSSTGSRKAASSPTSRERATPRHTGSTPSRAEPPRESQGTARASTGGRNAGKASGATTSTSRSRSASTGSGRSASGRGGKKEGAPGSSNRTSH